MEGYRDGSESDFMRALEENTLLDFVPAAPVMLIHSKDDETVPFFNSGNLMEYYQSNGKSNIMLNMIEGDHESAAEAAIVGAMLWFETLRNP
jgi:predicted esterase